MPQARGKTIIDGDTGSGETVVLKTIKDAGGYYLDGLSSDEITLEYRPSPNDAWKDYLGGNLTSSDNPVDAISPLWPGEYRATRTGNNDTVTFKLLG